jgi:hypothetical protein
MTDLRTTEFNAENALGSPNSNKLSEISLSIENHN